MSTAKQIERFRKAYKKALECKWKGGIASIASHLKRRKKHGHLSENSTETELIQRGLEVLKSPSSKVSEYIPSGTIYFVVYKEWAVFSTKMVFGIRFFRQTFLIGILHREKVIN